MPECECEYGSHTDEECGEVAVTNVKVFGGWHAVCRDCRENCVKQRDITEEDPRM